MTAISVVMGVYNGARFLPATLDSILAQSEGDFELIVVDDGSTDQSPAILRDYVGRDARVRVIRKKNEGLTRALIDGCNAARGTYIARHDAGDLSDPRRFALQKAALDANPAVVFVSCATQYAGPELEPLYVVRSTGAALDSGVDILDPHGPRFLRDAPTSHPSVMFRRDAYERSGGYRPAFYVGQDYDLWYRLAQLGKLRVLPEVLYTARVSPDSISTGARAIQEAIGTLSREALLARMAGRPEDEILRNASALRATRKATRRSRAAGLYFVGEALRRNRDPRSLHYLRRSVAEYPFSPRAWLRLLAATMTRFR